MTEMLQWTRHKIVMCFLYSDFRVMYHTFFGIDFCLPVFFAIKNYSLIFLIMSECILAQIVISLG